MESVMLRQTSLTKSISHPYNPLITIQALILLLETDNKYAQWFDSVYLETLKHIRNMIIHSESNKLSWGIQYAFTGLPFFAQKKVLNLTKDRLFPEYQLARKLMVSKIIEQDIESGISQLIFFCNDFDPRPFLLAHKYRQIQVYEIGYGVTQEIKLNALMKLLEFRKIRKFNKMSFELTHHYACFGDNFHLIDANYLEPGLLETLQIHGFDLSKAKTMIIDGITRSLPHEDYSHLLSIIHSMTTETDNILITFPSHLIRELTPVFVQKYGFNMTGKMLDVDLLDWIQCNPTINKSMSDSEHYYTLSKNVSANNVTTKIEDVKKIILFPPTPVLDHHNHRNARI